MQTNTKKEIMVTALYTAAFLLGGLIHIVVDPWDFTSCITQIYYSALVVAWAVTVSNRVVNKRVRRLMLMTAVLIMMAIYFQMCRYRIFEDFPTFSRYLWYGYYIPVLLAPVLFLFVVLHLHLHENEKPNRHWLLMLIPSLVLIVLVMTNDLHQLIFRFAVDLTGRDGTYTHGMFFYAVYVWVIVVMALALYLAISQCRIPGIEKKMWIPLYFAAYSILFILSLFEIPKIGGTYIWLFIDCLAMVILGMEEACIQLGLIPANSSYGKVAALANKPFVISDEDGTPVYAGEAAGEMFQRKEAVQIHTKPIKGGSVSWAVDMTDMIALNREIEKTTETIQSKNEFLQSENVLKEEHSRLTARNELYNQIAHIVSPQLDTVAGLLESAPTDGDLAKIAFLNVYIKRRSNMELLRSDRKHFPTEELASAIRESCEYLKLRGVDAMLYITPECELSAEMQLFLYEAFETVAEAGLDTLQHLLVNITLRGAVPVLRMTLKAPGIDEAALRLRIIAAGGAARIDAEDDEATVTVTRQEGGADL